MADAKRWPAIEEELLAFWERERVFEQTIARVPRAKPTTSARVEGLRPTLREEEASDLGGGRGSEGEPGGSPSLGEFVFFEGPPTANAPPGIHHVIGRTFKDVIPRYQTMRGKRVRRKAGWDTHGLPVELQIEKKLGLKTKRGIEQYGVARFNAACRDSVWAFKAEWERLTERIGFWLDQRDPYVTYESSYTESVWWFLRQAWERKLLVRNYKIVPWCPRCETPLSSHEVALGYEDDVEDPSVMVRFVLTAKSVAQLRVPDGTSFLVWTTTPWTLPGNGALAVHPKGEYAIVRHGDASVILARPLVERVLGDHAVVERMVSGEDLVGLRYEPLYPRIDTAAYKEAYQALEADFVSFDDGTGIVHIAPAYGEDDFTFKRHGIPPTFSVNEQGIMADGLPGAGKFCKDADTDIRADLKARDLLFRDETIRHTYPFCWRCRTPLLSYAREAWFIAMSQLRAEIQAKNATIHWHPDHIRDGRFGEWLRELKDWAITRERSWGTPLPIWACDRCSQREVLGSFADLITKAPKRNRFILMRHGEAESNRRGLISATLATSDRYPLTPEGRARVMEAATRLRDVGITTIIASPYHRMRQTAEIVAETIGYPVERIVVDDRLREIDLPDFDGKPVEEHRAHFATDREKFTERVGENETWDELARRMLTACKDIDAQHEGETILICSHGDPLFLLEWAYSGRTRAGITDMPYPAFDAPTEFAFAGSLVNDRGEFDVHRPYVDAIGWPCASDACGGTMRRFPEVVDVWLDSGCMPFAQHHYPFEKKDALQYPAAYISEAIDQTRGWFYTLLAVATVLGWEAPYRNVICYSHILDTHGKKMSKSKGNVVNPWDMIDRYGADVVRWYMLTVNQPWDPKLFDEADLARMSRKPFGMLRNVLAFWELHGGGVSATWSDTYVLDAWLRARFAKLHGDVTAHLDAYEITEAARAIDGAVDDLSTWWLRRSRERLKMGDAGARATFTAALRAIAVLLAPFAPFHADHVWRTLRAAAALGVDAPESVHLAMWDDDAPPGTVDDDPQRAANDELRDGMGTTRQIVRLGLEARDRAGIPVRQPLAKLEVSAKYAHAYHEIAAEELNVKDVVVVPALDQDVRLDTAITPELKREGMIRELIRKVNDLRKERDLAPTDRIRVVYACDDAELSQAIAEHREELARATQAVAWGAQLQREGAEDARETIAIGHARIALDITRETA